MLDIKRLRLLRELKLRGTLAAVSDALDLSPSSVSQQLTVLEQEAGVQLLEKAGRRVILTPAALVLVEHAGLILDQLERAEADVAASAQRVDGTVRLAVFQSAAHAVIPYALSLLRVEEPELRVEITEREPNAGLFEVAARDFDLVIAEQYPGHTRPHHSELDRIVFARDQIRLAVGPLPYVVSPDPSSIATDPVSRAAQAHPLALTQRSAAVSAETPALAPANEPAPSALARGSDATEAEQSRETPARITQLTDAAHLPWVMEPEGTASRAWALQLCRAAGFEPDVRFETADLMAHIRLILSGNAVGLLPDLVWAGEAPSVELIDLPGAPHREVFSAARRSAADRPAVLACRSALARAAGPLVD